MLWVAGGCCVGRQGSVILVVGVTVLCGLPCGGCRRNDGRTLNVVGSTSIQPFAELLGQEYGKKHADQLVDVQGGGSTAGLQAVANNLAQVGMCSRSLSEEESRHFAPIVIARDGLAIVVNPANPVNSLNREQLRGLFSGRLRNWKEVGGKDGPVRPITREEGSGTRESFVNLVMGKTRISRAALTQESNGAVKELVRGDPAAIGYMSLGLVGSEIKALAVDGAKPTAASVLAGEYGLVRPFLFVTKGTLTPEARGFVDFVLSAEGQKALECEGLIRAR